MDTITKILIVIFGMQGFWTLVTEIWKSKHNEKKEQVDPQDIKLMKDAMLAMLHDRLYQACRYYLSVEKIDEDGYNNIETMYTTYHRFGGNGTGTELYNRTRKLKIVENIDEKER